MNRYTITILFLSFFFSLFSSAQNMQLADLYLTYGYNTRIIPLDADIDLIATSWDQGDQFYPDHRDFNSYVDNTKDAYLVWQEAQNHKYQKHIRFAGDSVQQIERIWVSDDDDIFIVLSSSYADTISVLGQGNTAKFVQPNQGNTGLCYFLVKLNKAGVYQQHLFLGYYGYTSIVFHFPRQVHAAIPMIMYSADSNNYIPGTTIKLAGSQFAKRSASFKIDCNDLKVSNIKSNDYEIENINVDYANPPEVVLNDIVTFQGKRVPDSTAYMIRYNGGLADLKDSLFGSRNTKVISAVSILDTLYLTHRSNNTDSYQINQFHFNPKSLFISKWINGVLVDSVSTSLYDANFFLDKSNQLYFYGYAASLDSQLVKINFLKGKPYLLKDDDVFRFWGPIEKDSLKWLSHIAGNHGLGTSRFYFYADSAAQYFQTMIASWMDLDPGPYEWQFSPSTYHQKSVIAKYNCFPNAVFILDQTAQKVQFYNFSSGGQTYKWLFGVGSASSTDLNPIFKYPAIGDYDVTLIAYNECGSDTFTFPVSVDKLISVEDINVPDVHLYPNPVSHILTIEHGLSNGLVTLSDLSGKTIWMGNIEKGTTTIDVTGVQSGMYLVAVKSKLSTVTKRIRIN